MKEKINNIFKKYNNLTEIQKKLYLKVSSAVAVFMLTVVLLFTITAAWYSNIVEVEELKFEVDSWGVDGTIMLDDEVLLHIAPGDSDSIPFKVDNNADSLVNLQFNAYKKYLPDFMQQRFYFYIEDEIVVNGETLDKVYIHDDNAYYYTLLGGQTVDNTGDVHSEAELKWEWVYDLLGYYAIIETDENGFSTETAYIRPVQYTYEKATYDSDTGELVSIMNSDGTVTTAENFIMELLQTDGLVMGRQTEDGFTSATYTTGEDLKKTLKFNVNSGEVTKDYYEIYTNEVEGYGIYMYLCDYNEIAVNNKIDTYIGNGVDVYAITENHFAAVQISCGQALEYFIEVSTPEELVKLLNNEVTETDGVSDEGAYVELLKEKDLLAEKEHVIIRLMNDMKISPQTLKDCNMVIDLNGHSLICNTTAAETLFTLNPDCSLKMYNGTIEPNGGVPFVTTGATLILKDVMINTTGAAVSIQTNGYQKGSNVQLINCTWNENRAETTAAVVETEAEANVPSFICIKETEENITETAGEVTE